MSFIHEQVTTFVDRINSPFIPEPLRKLKHYANQNSVPVLYDESLVFLQFITRMQAPDHILEIGTAIGYSGSAMLLSCAKSRLSTIEIDEMTYRLASENFKALNLSHRVRQYLGDAAQILNEICELQEAVDMIFIDAAKAQYLEYFKLCEPLMSRDGIVVFDNVLYKGIVAGLPHIRRNNTIEKRLNELFSYIIESERYEMSLLTVGDGMLLVKPRMS